jgi:hypothetical protein
VKKGDHFISLAVIGVYPKGSFVKLERIVMLFIVVLNQCQAIHCSVLLGVLTYHLLVPSFLGKGKRLSILHKASWP